MTVAPPEPLVPFVAVAWNKAAARSGFNIEPVLRSLGIEADLAQVNQPTVRISQFTELMEACVARAQAQGHHFPFIFGETFDFDYLPDLETFLTTSPTLRESARVFKWVQELINPLIDVRVEEVGMQARLLLDMSGGNRAREPLHYFAEATIATILKFSRSLLGEVSTDSFELWFRHPAPPYAAQYERFFGIPTYFGKSENALIFDRVLLDRPLKGAFPALHRQAEELVERRITQLPQKASLSRIVEQTLGANPDLLGRGIERVAGKLKMHPRTLQRRLRDEGQSFADLLARARFRTAAELLQNSNEDIETISERLGFSDRRSFTRAFTRWAGASPSAFRRRPGTE